MRKINLLMLYAFMLLCFGWTRLSAQSYSLYGITDSGGTYGYGVMYRYDYPSGNETVLINFNGINGSEPDRKLVLANNGYIYGATRLGGTYNYGVIYRYDINRGTDTVLFNFGSVDGASPEALAMQATNGLLYGATFSGGTYSDGTLFSFDPVTNVQSVLINFSDTTGYPPEGFVIQASNGLIYGHTTLGGSYNDGVLFCYNISTGKDSVVLNYNGTNGHTSREIAQANNGLIYGITEYGGTFNEGVLYAFNPLDGDDTVLVNFAGANGIYPSGSPRQASNGMLYGIAEMGGTTNEGLIFRYNISTGQDTIIYNFPASGNMGENPFSVGYVQAPGGLMYIPVGAGGAYGKGVLLTIDPVTNTVSKVFDFNGANGADPVGVLLLVTTCRIVSANFAEKGNLTGSVNSSKEINNEAQHIIVYPNPCKGAVVLSLSNINEKCGVNIYNILGVKVYSFQSILSGQFTIDLSAQPNGIYFYRVIDNYGSPLGEGKVVIEK